MTKQIKQKEKTFLNHLKLAHFYWKNHLKKKSLAIDCTMGNGFDLLILAKCLLPLKGTIYGLDIQKKALLNSSKLISKNFTNKERENIHLLLRSHETFDFLKEKCSLFVYNLGFLPWSDKKIKTNAKTTLKSLNSAIDHLSIDGAISIMCYPGHKEGKEETHLLEKRFKTLSSFDISFHRCYKKKDSPCLFWLKKKA